MSKNDTARFDQLIEAAQRQPFSGWDFSALAGRWRDEHPSWDYRRLVREKLPGVITLLDMGTGGGELLASFAPLPARTFATENYAPNVPIARQRLAPLGVEVLNLPSEGLLPFDDGSFDLIINRHESYTAAEVYRLLRPGGCFLTQQVGGRDNMRLNEVLQATSTFDYTQWILACALQEVEASGLQVVRQQEEFPKLSFYDIGAVVYYLKAIPWQIPDFTIEAYRPQLWALHQQIQAESALVVNSHRFLIEAYRPSP